MSYNVNEDTHMFSARTYFQMTLEHPRKCVVYDSLNNNYFYFDKAFEKREPDRYKAFMDDVNCDRFIELHEYSVEWLTELADKFAHKEENITVFSENGYVEKSSLSQIIKISQKIGLYDSLFEYCLVAESYDIYKMCVELNIKENEASEETYSKIADLLHEIRDKKYEKYYSEKNQFRVLLNSVNFSFVILGHGNNTYGISIYSSDNNEDIYRYIYKMRDSNMNQMTVSSLMEFISFYYDGGDEPYPFENPYKSNDLMSVAVYPGRFYRNYLSESLGIYCLNVLTWIRDILKKVTNEGFLEEIDSESFDFIDYNDEFDYKYYPAHQGNGEDYIDDAEFFYDFDDDWFFPIIKYSIDWDQIWSFTLRRLKDYYLPEPHESRFGRFGYVCFFANELTKKLEAILIFDHEDQRPLSGLATAISKYFEKKSFPGTIIINNELDYRFLCNYFSEFEDEDKIPDLEYVEYETIADDAYGSFYDTIDDEDIGEDA